ncbi:hypothetical protein BC629DRAFT_278643 [Irpex lacteus]|nr:hypothetical protein BC629DRAFT_278643 [Irpex lacteus]
MHYSPKDQDSVHNHSKSPGPSTDTEPADTHATLTRPNDEPSFCFCDGGLSGHMALCQGCERQFHLECVGLRDISLPIAGWFYPTCQCNPNAKRKKQRRHG